MTRGLVVAGAAIVLTALGGLLVAVDASPRLVAVVTEGWALIALYVVLGTLVWFE